MPDATTVLDVETYAAPQTAHVDRTHSSTDSEEEDCNSSDGR